MPDARPVKRRTIDKDICKGNGKVYAYFIGAGIAPILPPLGSRRAVVRSNMGDCLFMAVSRRARNRHLLAGL